MSDKIKKSVQLKTTSETVRKPWRVAGMLTIPEEDPSMTVIMSVDKRPIPPGHYYIVPEEK